MHAVLGLWMVRDFFLWKSDKLELIYCSGRVAVLLYEFCK